jgi:hypothetical protein
MPDREKELQAYYLTLKPIHSPALNETIHFNVSGLHHLLYERRRRAPRRKTERIYRLELLKYVSEVIKKADSAVLLRKSSNPPILTWSLIHTVIDRDWKYGIKVIVIQRSSGKLFFLSVMRISKNPIP